MAHDHETKSRVVAKILREILRTTTFETLADLTDALKTHLAALDIKTTPQDLSEAIAMLESNMSVVAQSPLLTPTTEHHEQLPDTPTFNKSEAAQIYRQLLAKYRAEQPSTSVPGAPEYFPALVMVR